jgi:transmembrane sensor
VKSQGRLELGKVQVGWDEGRTERLLSRVKTRLQRRARIRRTVLASAVLTSAVCGVWLAVRIPPGRDASPALTTASQPAQAPAAAEPVPGLIRLGDGSEIRLDPATSEVRVVDEQPARVRVEAVRGRARYSVVPGTRRIFEVHAGSVTVAVVGTEFVVERRGEQTWVEVSRGKVRVSWGEGNGSAFVAAGESGLFPRTSPPTAPESPAATTGRDGPSAPLPAPPSRAYRSRIGRHDYRAAYTILARHPALAGDTVEELLLAADVARLSEHPAEAVPYLQRILRDHPRDERAHQAAFTLGRTFTRLGRTREAVGMFARVRSEWPDNPLAEDALVRQAQAAAQLGDREAAQRLADEYAREYPGGRRRAEVGRLDRSE